jgi:hypothetical protein
MNESQETNPWQMPQARLEMKPYTILQQEPAKGSEAWLDWREQMNMLDEWLKGPQVEINYDLNDDTDYAVQYQTDQGIQIARISECVQINGVRWNLQPGKNIIPQPVYEFLLQCPEQRRKMSCPEPGRAQNIMGAGQLFRSSRSV